MAGKLFVIEGMDGSGKATQTKSLYYKLKTVDVEAIRVSFPNYDSPSSAPAKMYLDGEVGSIESVNAYAASSFYAVDRYITYRRDLMAPYQRGELLLCDRYTTSNALHQTAKMPEDEWDDYLDWLYDFEFDKLGIPRPDAVFFLDVPPEASVRLMEKRYHGDQKKMDIHERDLAYMEKTYRAAEFCIKKFGWTVIECCNGDEMLPPERITDELFQKMWSEWKNHD